jgi:hypothetical protein
MLGAMAHIALARPATRPTTTFFPLAVPDQAQLFQRGGLADTITQAVSQKHDIFLRRISNFF